MNRNNDSALDDEDLGQAICRGEIPLFSLQIQITGGVKKVRSVEDYGCPYNIAGGPRSLTVQDMHCAGLERISADIAAGRIPQRVTVNHDAFGNISVECSYKE